MSNFENSSNAIYKGTLYPLGQNKANAIQFNDEIAINVTGLASVEIFVPIKSLFRTDNLGYLLSIKSGQKMSVVIPDNNITEFVIDVISILYNEDAGVFSFNGNISDSSKWSFGFLVKRNNIAVFVVAGGSVAAAPPDLSAYAKKDGTDTGTIALGTALTETDPVFIMRNGETFVSSTGAGGVRLENTSGDVNVESATGELYVRTLVDKINIFSNGSLNLESTTNNIVLTTQDPLGNINLSSLNEVNITPTNFCNITSDVIVADCNEGNIVLRNGASATSFNVISTTNKSAIQYAADIAALDSAIPNKYYVDNAINLTVIPPQVAWSPSGTESIFVKTGNAAAISAYIASNSNLVSIVVTESVSIDAPIDCLGRVGIVFSASGLNATFSGTGLIKNPAYIRGTAIWDGSPSVSYIEIDQVTAYQFATFADITCNVDPSVPFILCNGTGFWQIMPFFNSCNITLTGTEGILKVVGGFPSNSVFTMSQTLFSMNGQNAYYVTGNVTGAFYYQNQFFDELNNPTNPQANTCPVIPYVACDANRCTKDDPTIFVTAPSTVDKWLEKLKTMSTKVQIAWRNTSPVSSIGIPVVETWYDTTETAFAETLPNALYAFDEGRITWLGADSVQKVTFTIAMYGDVQDDKLWLGYGPTGSPAWSSLFGQRIFNYSRNTTSFSEVSSTISFFVNMNNGIQYSTFVGRDTGTTAGSVIIELLDVIVELVYYV